MRGPALRLPHGGGRVQAARARAEFASIASLIEFLNNGDVASRDLRVAQACTEPMEGVPGGYQFASEPAMSSHDRYVTAAAGRRVIVRGPETRERGA